MDCKSFVVAACAANGFALLADSTWIGKFLYPMLLTSFCLFCIIRRISIKPNQVLGIKDKNRHHEKLVSHSVLFCRHVCGFRALWGCCGGCAAGAGGGGVQRLQRWFVGHRV